MLFKMFSKVISATHHGTQSNPNSLLIYRALYELHTFNIFVNLFCISLSSSSFSFDGKSALITGSTSGIGLSITECLASKGCKVIITGLGDTETALNRVKASALDSNKDQIVFIEADLSKKEESKRLVAQSVDVFGSLDIVVNNAGFQHVSPIESFDDSQYERMMNVMLNAPWFITKSVLPWMRRFGYGRVINIASAHGLRASPFKSAYCIAKHGVVGLTKACALEMALESNINWTANAICPGFVKTELALKQVEDRAAASGQSFETEEYALLSEKNATAQWVEPEAIAPMVTYLCTDEARQINGASWSIDGGWTAR